MSKKRSVRKAQAARAPEAPRQIQQISFSAVYDVASDRVESFSASPQSINPLALLRALQALEMQLMAAAMNGRQNGVTETPNSGNE